MASRADHLKALSQSTKKGGAVQQVALTGRVTSTSRPWPAFAPAWLGLTRHQVEPADTPTAPAIRRPLARAPAGRAAAGTAAPLALEGPRTAGVEGADWQEGVGQVAPASRPRRAPSASTLEGARSGTPPSVPWASPYSLGASRPQPPALTFSGG